jgi:hypothetical protein
MGQFVSMAFKTRVKITFTKGVEKMKTTKILACAFGLVMTVSALAQENWEQVVEGIMEGQRVDLYKRSTQHGFPTFCDIDGDGDHDLVLGGQERVRFYRNDGSDKAPKWTHVSDNLFDMPVNLDYEQLDPAPGDFDKDGDFDFVVTCHRGYAYYYRNDGNLQFTQMATQFFPKISSAENVSVDVGDLNCDGKLDLVIGARLGGGGNLYYSENVGSITSPLFSSNVDLGFDLEGMSFPIPHLVDLDTDGDKDLVVSTADYPTYSPKVFYFENDGTCSPSGFTKITNDYFQLAHDGWVRMGFYDYEEDHDQDCIVFDGQLGYVGFLQNTGTPYAAEWKFTRNVFQTFVYLGVNEIAAFGDLDNDGDLDALQAGRFNAYDWCLGYYENQGSPR